MSKIVLTNTGTVDQSVMNHGAGRILVPAGGTLTIVLNPAKDITSQAFLKKFYGQYADDLDIEFDISDYPMDLEKATVTFNSNGGSAVEAQEVYVGAKATRPEDPTKEEATFGGWYADEGLAEEFDFDKAIAEDTTVYAKWSAAAANNSSKVTSKPEGSVDAVKPEKADAKVAAKKSK